MRVVTKVTYWTLTSKKEARMLTKSHQWKEICSNLLSTSVVDHMLSSVQCNEVVIMYQVLEVFFNRTSLLINSVGKFIFSFSLFELGLSNWTKSIYGVILAFCFYLFFFQIFLLKFLFWSSFFFWLQYILLAIFFLLIFSFFWGGG